MEIAIAPALAILQHRVGSPCPGHINPRLALVSCSPRFTLVPFIPRLRLHKFNDQWRLAPTSAVVEMVCVKHRNISQLAWIYFPTAP